jgi:hypothetical protein
LAHSSKYYIHKKNCVILLNIIYTKRICNIKFEFAKYNYAKYLSQHLEDSVRLRRVRQETATKIDWLWRFGLLKGSYLSK